MIDDKIQDYAVMNCASLISKEVFNLQQHLVNLFSTVAFITPTPDLAFAQENVSEIGTI